MGSLDVSIVELAQPLVAVYPQDGDGAAVAKEPAQDGGEQRHGLGTSVTTIVGIGVGCGVNGTGVHVGRVVGGAGSVGREVGGLLGAAITGASSDKVDIINKAINTYLAFISHFLSGQIHVKVFAMWALAG